MTTKTRHHVLVWYLAMAGVTASVHGCVAGGGTAVREGSSTSVVDPPHEGYSVLHVTSTPRVGEVWIGAGSTDSLSSYASEPARSRCLGRTPVAARVLPGDLSPGGDLEISIRYGDSARRDTRIPHADRVLRQGGSFRVRADLSSVN